MTATQTEIQSQAIGLSAEAFEAFCEDISGMFGVSIKCTQQEICTETIEGLKKHFQELAAVTLIKAKGALEGTFEIIVNREGLFILAGVIAMPEQMTSLLEKCVGPTNIQENIKSGSLKEAKAISDVLTEAGNLMVGCWDRVFRKEMDGHGHFLQTNTFIGDPWDKPEETIGLAGDEEFVFVPYEMTIGSYPAFKCGVIFPETVFDKAKAEAKIRAEAEAKARAETEAKAKAEAEVKAKAEAEEKAKAEVERKAEIEAEAKTKVETEIKTKAEAEEKAKAEAEEKAKAEAEEKAATADEATEAQGQPVSKTIQKMTQSPAVLPGDISAISLAISAKDIMQKEVVWGSGDDSVQQALTKIQQAETGYMLVGTDGQLEGIVSKSDITGAVSIYLRPIFAKWRRPLDDATLQIRIKWIMSRPVRTIKPETSLTTIMENMRQFGGRCLPVADQQGKVQGLVTVFDIYQALLSGSPNISYIGKTHQAPPLAQLDLSDGKGAQDAKQR